MPRILFLPGNGQEFNCNVSYWADGFPRDEQGDCAFCHGNPVPDNPNDSLKATAIELYAFDRGKNFETCPVCLGRAS